MQTNLTIYEMMKIRYKNIFDKKRRPVYLVMERLKPGALKPENRLIRYELAGVLSASSMSSRSD